MAQCLPVNSACAARACKTSFTGAGLPLDSLLQQRSPRPQPGPRRIRCVLQPASRPHDLPFHRQLSHPERFEQKDASGPTSSRGNSWRVIPDIWPTLAERHPDAVALHDPHKPGKPELTFKQLHDSIIFFAEGLKCLGLQKGDCVALLSENSHRWLIADQGVMTCGACDAVRGTRSSDKELQYIVAHADSAALIVENEQVLKRLLPLLEDEDHCPPLKFIIVLWPSGEDHASNHTEALSHEHAGEQPPGLRFPVLGFSAVMEEGKSKLEESDGAAGVDSSLREDDIATMVFTSGTTGEPKAVMLTHSNLMHQVGAFRKIIDIGEGEALLSLLPPWHMYERSCEYYALSQGVKMVYSTIKSFKEDLTKYPPDLFVAVPLVFEVLYNGVQKKLAAASAARAAIANWLVLASLAFMDHLRAFRGMALPRGEVAAEEEGNKQEKSQWGVGLKKESQARAVLDVVQCGLLALLLLPLHLLASKLVFSKVRAAIPIKKLAISGGGSLAPHVDKFFEAMGLTLLNGYGLTETSPVLAVRRPDNNLLGTVGLAIDHTRIKVVDPVTGATLPDGVKGKVKGKGPQIMKGYYKNPAATAACIDGEGWFDTGDVGWITPLVPKGRSRNCGRQLVLDGRAKDTIVLANGENVEPSVVEEAVLRSPAISQIMVIGQDQRKLSALVVPNEEAVLKLAAAKRGPGRQEDPVTEEEARAIVASEIRNCLKAAGAGDNERIGSFATLKEPFSIENGLLTATMKMRRDVIYKKYQDVCTALFEGKEHRTVMH